MMGLESKRSIVKNKQYPKTLMASGARIILTLGTLETVVAIKLLTKVIFFL